MTSRRLMFGTRRVLTAVVAALLLVMATGQAVADPLPGLTRLSAALRSSADSLIAVAGTLVDQTGTPVPGATIHARIDGAQQATAITDVEGDYLINFTLAEALRTQPQELLLVFDGQDGLDASQGALVLAATDATPPPTQPVALLTVTLEASVAASTVSAGGLVTVEGTLLDQNGSPVSGVRIRVMLDGTESPDSLVMTDEGGNFQTFAEVPSERPAGEASLAVSFAGNDVHAPASQEIGLVVDPIPVTNRTSPAASPTTSESADDIASMDPSMTPATNDGVDTAPGDADRSPLSWFYVALIVVGGAALLTTAGLVFRGMYGRRDEAVSGCAGGLDMLLDQASDDGGSRGHAPSTLNDEGSTQVDGNDTPGEDPSPRRAMD